MEHADKWKDNSILLGFIALSSIAYILFSGNVLYTLLVMAGILGVGSLLRGEFMLDLKLSASVGIIGIIFFIIAIIIVLRDFISLVPGLV